MRLRGRKTHNLTSHAELQQAQLTSVAAGRCRRLLGSHDLRAPRLLSHCISQHRLDGAQANAQWPQCAEVNPIPVFFFLGPGYTAL